MDSIWTADGEIVKMGRENGSGETKFMKLVCSHHSYLKCVISQKFNNLKTYFFSKKNISNH